MKDECQLWQGNISNQGYGRLRVGGRMVFAHRIAYCKANELPLKEIDSMLVRHRCDTPACINPNHLELGDNSDNIRDRNLRGRTARGERGGRAKLTTQQVMEIRARRAAGERITALGAAFNVTHRLISAIALRKIWKHVP